MQLCFKMKMRPFSWFGFWLFVLCSLPVTTGQSNLICSPQPIIALAGDDVILPCRLDPPTSASFRAVEWTRAGLDPEYIHVHQDGRPVRESENPLYHYRTVLFVDQLKNGNISLKLLRVKISDAGIYKCFLPSLHKEAFIQISVGVVSLPAISLVGTDKATGGVTLKCESAGWYPEPEVLWLDGEGKLLSAGPTETVRGPDDLYTVSSRVTVEKRHSNSFTCRVQQNNINQTRETHIQVPDDLFVAPCSSAVCLSISLVACFTCLVAVGFAAWKWRQNKIKSKMTSQRERQRLMAESEQMKDTEKKMADFAEELQRKEEEHKNMADALMKQKEELKKQTDKLNFQKTKMEELVENNETKLQSAEKDLREKDEDKGFISSPGFIKLKEIISENKWSLNIRLGELEKLVLDTEKLLEMTEGVIVRTTEKKKESENHMDKK